MKTRFDLRYESKKNRLKRVYAYDESFGDFTCTNCHRHVSVDSALSGVQNRNHCPYCLWSKHLDLYTGGDRLAACKSPMQPIGLTFKKGRNKYRTANGELMLVHQCLECDKLSINRIAADDDGDQVLSLYKTMHTLEPWLKARLDESDVQLLEATDEQRLQAQLFGREIHALPLGS